MNKTTHHNWIWVLPLLLLTFWLGLRLLTYDLFWFDELRALDYATIHGEAARSFSEIWDTLSQHKWQSPGYYFLLSLWGRVFGWGHFGGRMLSLMLGVMTLAFMYRLGCDVFSSRVGLYSTVILTSTAIYIYYLHEMRPYTLYLLLTCICIWAYWLVLQQVRPSYMMYMGLFTALVGLAYTHTLALLTPIGIGVYHLLFVAKDKRWLFVSGIMLLSLLAALPWLFVTLGIGYDISLVDRVLLTARDEIAMFGFEIPQRIIYAFGNGNTALVLVLLAVSVFQRKRALWFVWILISVSVGVAMVVSYIVPAFVHIRYLMAVLPALVLLMAIGVDYLAQQQITGVVVLTVWFVTGLFISLSTDFHEALQNSVAAVPREGFMQMVHILEQVSHEDEYVLLHTASFTQGWASALTYQYYLRDVAAEALNIELIQPYAVEADEELYMQVVEDVIHDTPVIWVGVVPRIPQTFRTHALFKQLNRSHTQCQIILDRDDIQFELYAQQNDVSMVSFSDGQVQAEALWDVPQTASGTLSLLFGWQRDFSLPPDTYSVSLRLENVDGFLVRQDDYGLSNNAFSCHWSQIDIEGLHPGQYALYLTVYNWRTLERMSADNIDGENTVFVGSIRIE